MIHFILPWSLPLLGAAEMWFIMGKRGNISNIIDIQIYSPSDFDDTD